MLMFNIKLNVDCKESYKYFWLKGEFEREITTRIWHWARIWHWHCNMSSSGRSGTSETGDTVKIWMAVKGTPEDDAVRVEANLDDSLS